MFGDKQRNFAMQVFFFFFGGRVVHNWCHCNKPVDCQVLICTYIVPFHSLRLFLNFQAIVIIAKLSFWINKPFLASVREALDQYKKKGYVQKLKTDITPHFMQSDHEDFVTLLYSEVTHIDGMSFI